MAAAAESVLVPEDVALRLMLPTRVLRIPQCWRDQHGLRFAVSVNSHEEAIELHVCIDATKPFFFAESRSVISV